MGIGITAPLVTIRLGENRIADSGGVLTGSQWPYRCGWLGLPVTPHWSLLVEPVFFETPLPRTWLPSPPVIPQRHGISVIDHSWSWLFGWGVPTETPLASGFVGVCLFSSQFVLEIGFVLGDFHIVGPLVINLTMLKLSPYPCIPAFIVGLPENGILQIIEEHYKDTLYPCWWLTLRHSTWGHVYDSVAGWGRSVLACFIVIVCQLLNQLFPPALGFVLWGQEHWWHSCLPLQRPWKPDPAGDPLSREGAGHLAWPAMNFAWHAKVFKVIVTYQFLWTYDLSILVWQKWPSCNVAECCGIQIPFGIISYGNCYSTREWAGAVLDVIVGMC